LIITHSFGGATLAARLSGKKLMLAIYLAEINSKSLKRLARRHLVCR
jgi:hypothetical protein